MTYKEVISKGKGQYPIFYEEYGRYQGDFLLVTELDNKVFIYKGCFGSCIGCDDLQNFERYQGDSWTPEEIKKFADEYKPFLTCDKDVFLRCLEEGTITSILPANTRLDFRVEDSKVWKDVYERIK